MKKCLESLVKQTSPGSEYEVIVVDNNSADNTPEVARNFIQDNDNFHYYLELKQGLSNARNRGCKEARGKYVAYIDDDAKARQDWIENILDFVEIKHDAKAFGGPFFPCYLTPPPPWFPSDYGKYYLGDRIRPLRENEFINGPNMIFSKDLLCDFGGFDPELGMTGNMLAYGEETRLSVEMKRKNIPIYYVPAIIVDHFIRQDKMTLFFLLKSSYKNGLDYSEIFSRRVSFNNSLFNFLKDCIGSFYIFCTCREKYFKTRLYRALFSVSNSLGIFLANFR